MALYFITHRRPRHKANGYNGHYDSAKAFDYPEIIFFVDEHKVCYKCYNGCHVHETRTMGEHKNEL